MINAVSQVLQQYQAYWQVVPFSFRNYPWRNESLNARLSQLSLDDIDAIGQCKERQRQVFGEFFPERFKLTSGFDDAINKTVPTYPFWLTNGIGGRKLTQIQAFINHIPQTGVPAVAVEWCAGKGHLGRLYSFATDAQVLSLEWQQQLCDAGEELARDHSVAQQFIPTDVMEAKAANHLNESQHVMALHACGDLHVELLIKGTQKQVPHLHVVPCCYHLISTPEYQPLSKAGQQLNLKLSRHDLKLSVEGQVTSGSRVARLRRTEVTWRLAYDSLRADITGDIEYRALRSVGKHWFTGCFSEFAKWAADQHQIQLPVDVSWEEYLQRGQQRQLLAARIDAVRHVFRRPLEKWLIYDRIEYLKEQGYHTQVREFVDYQITPRNILIQASRGCVSNTDTV